MRHQRANFAAPLLACLGGLALLAGAVTPAQAWEPKAYEGRYQIDFPSQPKESLEQVQTPSGTMTVRTLSVSTDDGVLAVQYYELPPKLVDDLGTDRFLDKARDGVISRARGRLVTEVVTPLEGYPGRAFLAVLPDQRTYLAGRAFLAGNRAYLVLATGSRETLALPEYRRFLKSFALLDRATRRDTEPVDEFTDFPEE